MGVVVAARHMQLDVLVALKFMTDDALTDPDLVARFLREARAAARLRGEHVARVTDVGTLDSGAPYLVMEYLEGRDLSAVLSNDGPQPIPSAVEYIVQACKALEEAHASGIVHRDVKPSNLFLTKRPDGTACIKVLDFGISKADRLGSSSAKLHGTHSRTVLGSPFYMSPEQMRAAREVDARTDVWALGATLYELLAGRVPFEAESLFDLALRVAQAEPRSLREIRPEVPWALEQVVWRCLEKDREDRFASAQILASALAPFAVSPKTGLRGREPAVRLAPVTHVSEGKVQLTGIDTTLPMRLAVPESLPPVAQSAPRGWRTGARVSWGRSQKILGRGARRVWGAAVVGVIVVGALLLWLRWSKSSSPANEKISTSADITASTAPPTTGSLRVEQPVAPPPPPAATLAAEPSTSIPTLSFTDLPTASPPVFAAPAVRTTAATPLASPLPSSPSAAPASAAVASATAAPLKPNCDPPYEFDANGNKRWKRDCF
jgi:hypothetical protein